MSERAPRHVSRITLSQVAVETLLTAVLLFVVLSSVRWLGGLGPLSLGVPQPAVTVVGVVVGVTLLALILSPPGRFSGAHLNPAVTTALWLMDAFPGREVPKYLVGQLSGSVVGVAAARVVWGESVTALDYGAVKPGPGWSGSAVFLAETGVTLGVVVLLGFFLAHPGRARYLPWTLAVITGATIAVLGSRTGGSANPARQFGPAILSGETTDLVSYLGAPVIGAVLGAGLHHLLVRRLITGQPLTYRLAGPTTSEAARVLGPASSRPTSPPPSREQKRT